MLTAAFVTASVSVKFIGLVESLTPHERVKAHLKITECVLARIPPMNALDEPWEEAG